MYATQNRANPASASSIVKHERQENSVRGSPRTNMNYTDEQMGAKKPVVGRLPIASANQIKGAASSHGFSSPGRHQEEPFEDNRIMPGIFQ